ncbi:MAG TPA: tetratricopeptide repeat protein [Terriglobales bacterium]|nr:tetratricopeptide repeat protein [Terriglobales bacterium]
MKPTSEAALAPQSSATGPRLLLALALLLTALAYIATLGFQFVNDDGSQIVLNRRLESWSYVPSYFQEHVWAHMQGRREGNYYRPVFLLWLLVNRTLFGLNPMAWHASSLVLHLAVTLMVGRLALAISRDAWLAAFAALIFGLHPVHIEAVAWVSSASDPLAALFACSAFLFWLCARQEARRPLWPVLSLLSYALALLTKESVIVLPLMIALYAWMTDSSPGTVVRALRQSLPYWLLTLLYLPVRFLALGKLGNAVTPVTWETVLWTLPSVVWFYARKLLLPVGLSAFYDSPFVTSPGFASFVLPLLALLALAAVAALCWRRWPSPALAAGLVWLLPILPVLNLPAFRFTQMVGDRYLYLPSVGFVMLVALAVRRIRLGRRLRFGLPAGQVAILLLLLVLLGAGTAAQAPHWATNLLLYSRGVEIAPQNVLARAFLANELLDRGQTELAISLYREILAVDPNYWWGNFSLGITYYRLGDFAQAERLLSRAIQADPRNSMQFLYLGLVRRSQGDLPQAQAAMEYAIRLDPDVAGYHTILAEVLEQRGDLEGALRLYREEAALFPRDPDAAERVRQAEARLHQSRQKHTDTLENKP